MNLNVQQNCPQKMAFKLYLQIHYQNYIFQCAFNCFIQKKNGEPVSLKTAQANLFLVTLGPSKELRTVLKPPSRQILVQM